MVNSADEVLDDDGYRAPTEERECSEKEMDSAAELLRNMTAQLESVSDESETHAVSPKRAQHKSYPHQEGVQMDHSVAQETQEVFERAHQDEQEGATDVQHSEQRQHEIISASSEHSEGVDAEAQGEAGQPVDGQEAGDDAYLSGVDDQEHGCGSDSEGMFGMPLYCACGSPSCSLVVSQLCFRAP